VDICTKRVGAVCQANQSEIRPLAGGFAEEHRPFIEPPAIAAAVRVPLAAID